MDEHTRSTHAQTEDASDDDDASYIVKKFKVTSVTSQRQVRCFVDDCAEMFACLVDVCAHVSQAHQHEGAAFESDFHEASPNTENKIEPEQQSADEVHAQEMKQRDDVKQEAPAPDIKPVQVKNEPLSGNVTQTSRRRPRKMAGGRRLESIVSGLSANLQLESSACVKSNDVSENLSAQACVAQATASAASSPAEFLSQIGVTDDVSDAPANDVKSEEDWKEWSEREGVAIDDEDAIFRNLNKNRVILFVGFVNDDSFRVETSVPNEAVVDRTEFTLIFVLRRYTTH